MQDSNFRAGGNNSYNTGRDNDLRKKKVVRKKKTRKDRMKESLRPKPTMVSFTNDFLNNICRANGIPVLQEKWLFKKTEME
jgi:hypothetical protein